MTSRPAPPAPGRPAAIRARGWGWRHAGRKAFAVSGLDLDIAPGERVLLLGASGAGKSTLLHALAGVLGAAEEGEERGSLTLDGAPASGVRGRAGLVLQDPDSQTVLARVGDEVAFGAENLAVPREQIWPRVRSALGDVGLDLPLDHSTSALSGGQKQRLALAGALAMEPGLLLLDEPTANLDPDGVTEVRDAVRRVVDRTGATLVVVEHRVAVWADVVDRVVVLAAGGGILADGTPQQVLGRAASRDELARAGIWVPGVRPATRAEQRRSGAVLSPVPSAGPAAHGEALLEAEQLTVARLRRGAAVVQDVSLQLRRGQALSIVGPNGAGKSTLALTLAGLLPPSRGRLEALAPLDRGAGPAPHRWRSAELVTRIGSVFQEPEHQFLTARVIDELEFGPRRVAGLSAADARAKVEELIVRLRLGHLLQANPFTLSGGEKRRLSVATMLATGPDILMLDEPTFGQDAHTWAELVDLLDGLVMEGRTVVSVTHDEDYTAVLSDSVIRIDGGQAALAGADR
ncbi:ATP-binding cassette domain-containing protein [Paenarthrobacter sp. DKR-5]|uniref:ABC transporter ATP-binding protein n=1 Tax=Paenarthrobacter sp. DKR-5 TaxID=2835535 RepID=UPI001BDD35F2|nr:ATP-binding cassette domain-containing protein [Paenarthrobacter sp. DKR-5]MBT1001433.1 ATP-binding cassette domain-containing protein [Paenarthrobacter sp. DKR-5]